MTPVLAADAPARRVELAAVLQQDTLRAALAVDGPLRAALLAGHATGGHAAHACRLFAGTRDQVSAARHYVRARLAAHDARDDAVAVASELAANAVEHSASGLRGGLLLVYVSQLSAGHEVALIVTDLGGPHVPRIGPADAGAESGRGLSVVRSLSSYLAFCGDRKARSVIAVISGHRDLADSGQ